jgi:hypothetical protein
MHTQRCCCRNEDYVTRRTQASKKGKCYLPTYIVLLARGRQSRDLYLHIYPSRRILNVSDGLIQNKSSYIFQKYLLSLYSFELLN